LWMDRKKKDKKKEETKMDVHENRKRKRVSWPMKKTKDNKQNKNRRVTYMT
jgi:hypothetical protein